LELGPQKIVLDCGGGVVSRLIEAGHSPAELDLLVFSHLHSDHMMDYARLVHAHWDEGGQRLGGDTPDRRLQVHGPAPIATITQRLFGPEGAFAFDLTARCELQGSKDVWLARGGSLPRPWPQPAVHEVEPGFTLEGPGWRITSCSVPHAQPYLTCMALRLDTEDGRSFVYSGDAALCPALEALAAGADVMLHWCYRHDEEPAPDFIKAMSPSPSELGALAARCGVKTLALTHFRAAVDRAPGLLDRMRAAAEASFGGQVIMAHDLMSLEI
jgi:ribonuclease Z